MDTYDLYYEVLTSNIVEGFTKVRVVRKAKSFELGWDNSWVNEMDASIGNTYTVMRALGRRGINLSASGYSFPPFVLEIVEV